MKVINPSIEVMRTGMELTETPIQPEQFIEKVGRTCYKSEDKITDDSAAKFVSGLIKRGHEAMIEHWTLIFMTDEDTYQEIVTQWFNLVSNANANGKNKKPLRQFLRFTSGGQTSSRQSRNIISGNMRAWRDYCKACLAFFGYIPSYLHGMIRNYPLFFPEFQDWVPANIVNDILIPINVKGLVTEKEKQVHHDVTIKFICDRGVSHEIVRHRTSSFAQESTRYCNYSGDKYGKEITVIAPSWCEPSSEQYDIWVKSCIESQETYFRMLESGCTPQEARSVLPNSLKTELIMTTNMQGWNHFLKLRCAKDAHPDIQVVANMVNNALGDLYK